MDLEHLNLWSKKWLVKFSAPKSKAMLISTKPKPDVNINIFVDNEPVELVLTHKHLGITLSCNLKWTEHTNSIYLTCMKPLDLMRVLKYKLTKRSLETIFLLFDQ